MSGDCCAVRLHGVVGRVVMSDNDLFGGWGSWNTQKDWDEQNRRISEMPEPDYSLKPSPQYRRRTVWFSLPTNKPVKVEGENKRTYNVKIVNAFSGVDQLGSNYDQIQAYVDGHRLIVNHYEDGGYVVKSGNHVYRATDDNLDDVIDGCVS